MPSILYISLLCMTVVCSGASLASKPAHGRTGAGSHTNTIHATTSEPNAIGWESNGQALYACVGSYRGSRQIGKTTTGSRYCHIAYRGSAVKIYQFERLQGRFDWLSQSMTGAMAMGREKNGTPLYVCRAAYKNGWQVGKTWPGLRGCMVVYSHHTVVVPSFFVLHKYHDRPQVHRRKAHGHAAHSRVIAQKNTHHGHSRAPKKQCITDNFNKTTCGYNCAQTPFKIMCAPSPDMNCVKNSFQKIRCGKNCRVDRFQQIRCNT